MGLGVLGASLQTALFARFLIGFRGTFVVVFLFFFLEVVLYYYSYHAWSDLVKSENITAYHSGAVDWNATSNIAILLANMMNPLCVRGGVRGFPDGEVESSSDARFFFFRSFNIVWRPT